MISFFRNALSSWLTLGLFALILLAFMITGFGTGGSGGISNLAGGGDSIVKIGSMSISGAEASTRIKSELEGARQERPGLDMAAFDKLGGVDSVIERLINSRVILAFGEKHGMVISERLIDSEIAKTPAFYGPTGKFDRNVYLGVIGSRKLSEPAHRDDVRASLLANQIIPPAAGAAKAPLSVVSPYASLLLETRYGQASFVTAESFAAGPPSAQEIKDFHTRNAARYTVAETRVIRYATFDRSLWSGKLVPSEAEIAAAYKADAPRYAATEQRVLSQVIVQSEAQAKTIAAKVTGGVALSKAAQEAGLEATTLGAQDKKAYAGLSSAAVADAAFAAAQGSVAAPAKSGLGWHVVRVDKVVTIAGKSLDAVRGEIVKTLSARKTEEALADKVSRIEDAVSDGRTFDDVAKTEGLTVTTLPAMTAAGISPGTPGYTASADLAPVLKDAFQSEVDDDPTVVTLSKDGGHALYKLDRINPAAAKPLASIQEQVAADTKADKALRAARKAATDVVTQVNKGTPFATALAAAKLPAARPLSAKRMELAQAGDKAPPPLQLLFKLAKGKARMIEADGGKGYLLVWLERLENGNAATRPDLVQATQGQLSSVIGDEYTQQLLAAMKADLGVTKNDAAIRALRANLLGGTSG
jgi:peptidyl-prolyl cis-trans isomerase D